MTAKELISEMYNISFPNFAYEYWGTDDEKHAVILGMASCPSKEQFGDLVPLIHITEEMLDIYEKDELTDSDKYILGKRMHSLQRMCNYRKKGLFKKIEQEQYLSTFTQEELDQIVNQFEMFKESKSFYTKYVYNK